MSVKGFLEKYFKPEVAKVRPESVLEPMVGVVPRVQVDRFNPTPSPTKISPVATILHLFTDGACSGNGQRGAKGGYGVHVYGKPELDLSLPLLPNEPQTNNRAELRAIQAALDLLDQNAASWLQTYSDIYIWSDSEYSINCLTKWAKGWKANGWRKKDGGQVQNVDLIQLILQRLARTPRVSFHHVRGHQDSRRNEFPYDGNHRADALATRSIS